MPHRICYQQGGIMEYKIEISKKHWSKCKICQSELKNMNKRADQYLTQRFFEHLRDEHDISFEDYLNQYEDVQTPTCLCGCGERTGIRKSFIGRLMINRFIKRHSTANDPKFIESVERTKETRKGSGNPMYGKPAWNKNLTKNNDGRMAKISQKIKGKKHSIEAIKKMSESAKKRTIHGHTGHKHSEETKRIIAKKTIAAIKRGVFKHTQTKPHIVMSSILDEMRINYKEEQSIEYWLFDFLLTDFNLYLEVDGDYFHCNPLVYPNGPETETQEVNYHRDQRKNKYCKTHGIDIIRFWESDIINERDLVKKRIMETTNEISKNCKC